MDTFTGALGACFIPYDEVTSAALGERRVRFALGAHVSVCLDATLVPSIVRAKLAFAPGTPLEAGNWLAANALAGFRLLCAAQVEADAARAHATRLRVTLVDPNASQVMRLLVMLSNFPRLCDGGVL